MYDFSARLYDPNVLAFTSVDPVASETPGVSPYSYCGGDPINFIDRTGLRRLGINSVGRIFQLQDDNKEGITLYRYDSYHKKIVSDVLPFNVPKELEPIIYELEKSTKERTRSAGAVVNSHSVFSFYDWILRSGTLIEWRLDIYKKDLEYLYAFGTRFDDIGSIGTSISDIATYQTGNSERIVSIHNHLQNPNRTYGPSALYENGTVIQGDLYEAKFSKCKNYVAVYDPDISDFSYSLYRYESWPINEMPGLKFSVSFPILGGLYNNCEKILNPDWHPSWNNKWTIEWKP